MNKWIRLFISGGLLLALAAGCAAPVAAPPAAPEAATTAAAEEAPAVSAPAAAPAMADESLRPPASNPVEPCKTTHEGEKILVHQQAGLTGPLASILGPGFINGTRDAVNEINASGGVCGAELTINLVDTQYAPEQELAAYEAIRNATPRPNFILTYGSGATIVLKDRVIEDKIPNLASGLDGESFYIPRNGYTIGTAPIYSDQFAGFLKWVKENWAQIKPAGAGDEIVVGVIGWANAFGAGATKPEALAYAESIGVTVLPLEQQEISPTADVTGQLQNLLVNGANVIWIQSLSFGPAQVIGTLRALGAWDGVVVGGVNWAMNQDVLNILGENAQLAVGMYGIVPSYWWTDTDVEGVQKALAAFEAGGYPETDKGVSYLLSYGSLFAIRDVLQHAINLYGYENLSGENFLKAMQDLGLVSAGGLFAFDVRGENRAPRTATIRRIDLIDGKPTFVTVQDFFELPDTRPPAP